MGTRSDRYFLEKKNNTHKNFQVQKNSTYNIGSIRQEESGLSFSSILVSSGSTAIELLHQKPSIQSRKLSTSLNMFEQVNFLWIQQTPIVPDWRSTT